MVTRVGHTASLLNAVSEFDSFLFAPIAEDKKGTVVSVLTAFARMNFDPWQKAADFARLPRELAKTKLSAMLAALPGMSLTGPEPGTIAARLVALLPAQTRPVPGSRGAWRGTAPPAALTEPHSMIPIAIFLGLSVAFQLFAANQPAPQPDATSATQTAGVGGTQTSPAGATTQPAAPLR
ncbi:MAG: hypothetical protein ABI697_10935 [Devosia sp.]